MIICKTECPEGFGKRCCSYCDKVGECGNTCGSEDPKHEDLNRCKDEREGEDEL